MPGGSLKPTSGKRGLAKDDPIAVKDTSPEPSVAGTSDDNPAMGQMMLLMAEMNERLAAMEAKPDAVPRHCAEGSTSGTKRSMHTMSPSTSGAESSAEEASDDEDPLNHLDAVLGCASGAQQPAMTEFGRMLQDFESFFEGEEEVGPELTKGPSNIVNASLRRKPNDATVKQTVAKYHLPANIPNLQVPKTNSDVQEALGKGPSILDFNLRKTQLSLSRAMVPILQWMHDFGEGGLKDPKVYLEPFNDSLRMLAATFNWLSHCRKDVVRNNLHDRQMSRLCGWDTPVGAETLFPFDVTKKVDDMRKTRKLGAPSLKKFKSSNNMGYKKTYRPQHSGQQSYKPQYTGQQGYKPQHKKKPFLGQNRQKGNKRQ